MKRSKKTAIDNRDFPASPAVVATVVGLVTMMLISDVASLSTQMAVLGGVTSTTLGLLADVYRKCRRQNEVHTQLLASLHAPVDLAADPDLFDLHTELSGALVALARQPNALLRRLTLVKLYSVAEEVGAMAAGKVTFSATEAWRAVYEQVLRIPGIGRYKSVAHIRTEEYWRDTPGERSMQLNFELLQQGTRIERLLILADYLWPPNAALPDEGTRKWMNLQYSRGVELLLVRESNLLGDPDLLVDFGIYGMHATGTLEVDAEGRTQRFVLDFDANSVALAEDRWQRLLVYAVSYRDLLEPSGS